MRWLRGTDLQYTQAAYLGGNPQRKIITLQKFSHRSNSSEHPAGLHNLGVLHWEDEPPEHLFFFFFFFLFVFKSFFPPFIFISWRLITLQYCSGFCHTLT